MLFEVGSKVFATDVLHALVRQNGLPPLDPTLGPQLVGHILQRVLPFARLTLHPMQTGSEFPLPLVVQPLASALWL